MGSRKVEIHGSRRASLNGYYGDLQKISFFRSRICGDSGHHQDTRNRFVWLVRALRIPRAIVKLELDSENEPCEVTEAQDEEAHRPRLTPPWRSTS